MIYLLFFLFCNVHTRCINIQYNHIVFWGIFGQMNSSFISSRILGCTFFFRVCHPHGEALPRSEKPFGFTLFVNICNILFILFKTLITERREGPSMEWWRDAFANTHQFYCSFFPKLHYGGTQSRFTWAQGRGRWRWTVPRYEDWAEGRVGGCWVDCLHV